MKHSNSFAILIFIIVFGIGEGLVYNMYGLVNLNSLLGGISVLVIALAFSSSVQVADQWEKVVVLRLGKFRALKGPGLFFIIPIIDSVPYWIDTDRKSVV